MRPYTTENINTGAMAPTIAKVNCQEIMKRNTNETMINMKDLRNIETLVESPSWITAISEPILLTINTSSILIIAQKINIDRKIGGWWK